MLTTLQKINLFKKNITPPHQWGFLFPVNTTPSFKLTSISKKKFWENFWEKIKRGYIYYYMKIIITEEQDLELLWYNENKDIFEEILYDTIDDDLFFLNYVLFKTKEETVDRVVKRIYDEWIYNKSYFNGSSERDEIKRFIKKQYSKEIIQRYNELRKKYPNKNY